MKKPIHQLIEENSRGIVERFVAAARAHDLPTRALTHEEVADHLHRYLAELVEVLREGMAHRVESSEVAKKHGEQRWYVGYDLKSVILEYGLFRKVILDVVRETGGALTVEECDPLGQFIHVAIADAAVEFMENSLVEINKALRLAERAKDSRDEVLAVVSHDLKSPLHVILGSASMLSTQLETGSLDAQREKLQRSVARIQRASATMNRLIGDLLDLGRLRDGKLRLDIEEHPARDIVREAFELSAPLAEARAVRLDAEVAAATTLACDRGRVLQVLANLLGNAIKFSPEGGAVIVRVRCAAETCTFEVCDSGPGIPPERLPLLFDRYWQAPDTAAQGTGLGLTIAKAFVELHGGSIHCHSEAGRGATFVFTLPRVVPPAASVGGAAGAAGGHQGAARGNVTRP